MDIYIEPKKKYLAEGRKLIFIKDIASVYCHGTSAEKINGIQIFTVPDNGTNVFSISFLDIVKAITAVFPDAKINNTGEKEVLIEYKKEHKKNSKGMIILSTVFVALILFFGTATAIMSFHSDALLPQIFDGYYNTFFNTTQHSKGILEIPYSIGLAVGITVFFNHIGKKKITEDPTPIEVQMTTYEDEVIKNQLDTASKKEKGK
ncbi:MAG: stage V sporulation protein AA [Clostridia bacterium]|jgi:stage V sporulation protein AA|nr:stage V sporulation protein AA [Clostridia bacterium]